MAKVRLELGAELDLLNKDELADTLRKNDKWLQDAAYGVRHQALPRMIGTPAGGVLNLGYDQPDQVYAGPKEGWYWAVSRVSVDGLAVTTTSPATGYPSVTASGNVTDPGATTTIASISAAALTAVAPAGSLWNVQWTASLQGTVAAGDQDNMQLNSNLASKQVGVFPAQVGNYPQTGVTFAVPSGAGILVQSIAAASGASAIYGAQITATYVPTTSLIPSTAADVVKIYNQNRFVGYVNAQPGYATFGQRDFVMKPGDFIRVTGTGLNTTAQVEVYGEAISVPGPMMWKLFV